MLESVAIIGILVIIISLFSLNVIRMRAVTDIFFDDGGNQDLARARRAHSTILQFSVIFLVALTVYEMAGAPKHWIIPICLVFFLGRLLHAYGMLKLGPKTPCERSAQSAAIFWPCEWAAYDLSLLYRLSLPLPGPANGARRKEADLCLGLR